MENSVVESLFLPWWKIPIYIVLASLGTIAIRISFKFDINVWLKARKEAKELRDSRKASRECAHIWTLYPDGPYSRCDKCLVLISTSILISACAYLDSKPVVSGQMARILMKPGRNEIVTSDYIGARH